MTLKKFKYIVEIEINASTQTIANNKAYNTLKKFNQPYMTNYKVIEVKEIEQ